VGGRRGDDNDGDGDSEDGDDDSGDNAHYDGDDGDGGGEGRRNFPRSVTPAKQMWVLM